MPKITPFLWFDTQAEDAANFYVSVFPNSRVLGVTRYPEGGPMPAGAVMTATFELDGMQVTALNGGSHFRLDEAFSLTIHTTDQAETDHYWTTLSAGGRESACGWLEDRFGLSWQVTPVRLMELISDPDKARAGRVMAAMMKMQKIDIAAIEAAAEG